MNKNIKLAVRQANFVTAPDLLSSTGLRKLQPNELLTHHFTLDQIVLAYETFDDETKKAALDLIVTNGMLMDNAAKIDEKQSIPFPVDRLLLFP